MLFLFVVLQTEKATNADLKEQLDNTAAADTPDGPTKVLTEFI